MPSSFEHQTGSPEFPLVRFEESTSELANPGTLEMAGVRSSSAEAPSAGTLPAPAPPSTIVLSTIAIETAPPTPTEPVETAPADAFAIGATVRDRYRIESVLGTGGSAIVYKARDLHLELADGGSACVAIKVLRPELRSRPQSIARLKREFRQTLRITHPNVVRVFDLDCHGDAWFIVMEVLEGRSLGAELRQVDGPFPLERAAAILKACGNALEFAHARAVVHGDLKPANVFLVESGDVRLLDFGASPESGMHGDEVAHNKYPIPPAATPAYASPEILARQTPEPRDDIFSLSCIAHELLFRQHPFQRTASEAHVRSTVPDLRDDLLEQQLMLLETGLALKREQRPKNVAALLEFLKPPPVQKPAPVPLHEPAMEAHSITVASEEPSIAAAEMAMENPPADEAAPALLAQAAMTESTTAWTEPNEHEWNTMVLEWPVLKKPTLPPVQRWAAAAALSALSLLAVSSMLGQQNQQSAAGSSVVADAANAAPAHTTKGGEAPIAKPAPQSANRFDSFVPQSNEGESEGNKAARAILANTNKAAAAAQARSAAPVQQVSFDVPSLAVSTRAAAAVLTLKRINGRAGRLRVSWRINSDSAVLGRDFSGPTSGVVELANWQTVQTLYVPLAHSSGAKKFTVAITGVSGGAKVAPNESVIVTLRDFG